MIVTAPVRELSDEQIATARAFNQRLLGYEDFFATITPVGDGVLLAVSR
jgi:predicted O-methyltransferase YrrM